MKVRNRFLSIILSAAIAFIMMPMSAGGAYADADVTQAGIGIYNLSNPDNYSCGTIDIASDLNEFNHQDVTTLNYIWPECPVTFTAKPAEGYTFKGWYEGVFGDSYFIESPSENLISDQNPYTASSADEAKALCAVFECTEHEWKFVTLKATQETAGRHYQVCSICGVENTEEDVYTIPILKISKIELAKASYAYTGKAIKPRVIVTNEVTELGDVYDVVYSNNINVGTATAKVVLKGNYEGTKSLTFKIVKGTNPLKMRGRTATVKYSKVKKKSQTLAVTEVIKFRKDAEDKKTYTLFSAKNGSKSFKKYFKINKTTGKVTVKKGLKKGTYKVKVKVKALGNSNYKASGTKTVTFTIKVK